MNITRLKYLAGQEVTESDRLAEAKMQASAFTQMDKPQRAKLLWGWSKDEQMNFKEWSSYLELHVQEAISNEMDELN